MLSIRVQHGNISNDTFSQPINIFLDRENDIFSHQIFNTIWYSNNSEIKASFPLLFRPIRRNNTIPLIRIEIYDSEIAFEVQKQFVDSPKIEQNKWIFTSKSFCSIWENVYQTKCVSYMNIEHINWKALHPFHVVIGEISVNYLMCFSVVWQAWIIQLTIIIVITHFTCKTNFVNVYMFIHIIYVYTLYNT